LLIAKELKRLDIDVVALTETRKENAGSLREDEYTFFWKGVRAMLLLIMQEWVSR